MLEEDICAYARINNKISCTGMYCNSGNFREGFIFAKLRIGEVSWK